ncbi:MAG: DUF2298 domain-containing protein [Anaerolineales bacterium]
MIAIVSWWLASTAVGLAAFGLAWRLFPALRDRGYGLSRALGLLVSGYAFWILTTTGVTRNDLGGAWAGALVLLAAAAWSARGRISEILTWARAHIRLILTMEGLFLGAYLIWCLVRAGNPEIVATEKPMELMFLNSILRSPAFPPRDAWLSGYAISYYYFGYILAAWLSRITGVFSGIAFNLTNALWFALTALGAASIVYNLLPERRIGKGLGRAWWAPLFVLISGNLDGFLEVLHSRHWFWSTAGDGSMTSWFWRVLGIKELLDPPIGPAAWMPQRYLWWWRASRVVHDVNLTGNEVEVIDEFPFFSFLLADNHPHLLALPFVLLGIGFALQVFLGRRAGEHRLTAASESARRTGMFAAAGVALAAAGVAASRVPLTESGGTLEAVLRFAVVAVVGVPIAMAVANLILGGWTSALSAAEFLPAALMLGALAFLNTWDFPIALSLLAAVMAWTLRARGAAGFWIAARTAIGVGAVSVLLYLLWYVGFSSQAGGVLPNLIFPTAFGQFLVMFAPAFVPIAYWLIREGMRGRQRGDLALFGGVMLGLPLGLFVVSLALGAAAFYALRSDPGRLGVALSELGATDTGSLWSGVVTRRLVSPFTALSLGAVLGACAVLLRRVMRSGENGGSRDAFVIILIGIGALLVLAPEFIYLRDSFGWRMNTVFKFYFAAWILWGLAAAWIAADVFPRAGEGWLRPRILILLPLALGMVYPVLATWTKANGFQPAGGLTLDGTAHLQSENPGEAAAIAWMNANLGDGVVAETVGGSFAKGVTGSYSGASRIAAHTGFPTVLGWPGHELQWRGGGEEMGSREQDIYTLYTTRDWDEAQIILARYGIDYVYVGPLEQSAYPELFTAKFDAYLQPVYQTDSVTIYAVPLEQRTGP